MQQLHHFGKIKPAYWATSGVEATRTARIIVAENNTSNADRRQGLWAGYRAHAVDAGRAVIDSSPLPSFSFDTRRLYLQRRVRPLRVPAASWTVSGFGTSGCLATLEFVSRGQIEFACARLMSWPAQGFTPHGYPPACLWGYMASGSFHGELLSDP